MDKQLWTAVDQYTTDLLLPPDPVLDAALAASDAAGLPSISVSPSQGKLLMLLAQLARRLADSGDRHAGRIQQHLAGAGARARWPLDHPRSQPQARRGSAEQYCSRRVRLGGGGPSGRRARGHTSSSRRRAPVLST